jgi:hypothetical protein
MCKVMRVPEVEGMEVEGCSYASKKLNAATKRRGNRDSIYRSWRL